MERDPDREDETRAVVVPIDDVLDLHTFQPNEVPQLLEDYLDACVEAGIDSVRIIHGKGRGILKDHVRKVLRMLPLVSSFSDAPANAGGWGATVVRLKRPVS